jgi:1,4-alpha-glucan branching enzyme
MGLVDTLHSRGIGVILDWVPSHFPSDEHGPRVFRRHASLRARRSAAGVPSGVEAARSSTTSARDRSFLMSSALFWLDRYHIDGLRVDAVASMLYLDYGRKAGEWIPNRYGGKENLGAIEFCAS